MGLRVRARRHRVACGFPTHLPVGSEALAEYVDQLNEQAFSRSATQAASHPSLSPWSPAADAEPPGRVREEPLLTFSHFLPRIELCPEKRYLIYPDLMKALGSLPLGRRVATLKPDVHCFGHSHFGCALHDSVKQFDRIGAPKSSS